MTQWTMFFWGSQFPLVSILFDLLQDVPILEGIYQIETSSADSEKCLVEDLSFILFPSTAAGSLSENGCTRHGSMSTAEYHKGSFC